MKISSAMAFGLLLSLGTDPVLAEQGHESHTGSGATSAEEKMDHGHMGHEGMKMGASGSAHAPGMRDMHERMKALHDHSKMMEGITDRKQLDEEMKKHMRMMDEMMEKMMEQHLQATSAGKPTS